MEIYKRILSNFPKRNLRMVFAYGSGVFQQTGHKDMSKNMIDFIFTVDNTLEWHKENIKRNRNHYSLLKLFGAGTITETQEQYGAGVYFNTLVPCEGRIIKYGVISTQALLDDLLDWKTLYVSGRLHKPVYIVHNQDHPGLKSAMVGNRQSAVHTALLCLPEQFTEEELYQKITGLSYSGDFRMNVGEDQNKIRNIVKPNMERFRSMYKSVLMNEEHLYWNKDHGQFEQSLDSASRYHHLNLLPTSLVSCLIKYGTRDGRTRDVEEILYRLSHNSQCDEIVSNCVSDIVKSSSFSQSVKGIITAGFFKSVKYSSAKVWKMMKSKKQK